MISSTPAPAQERLPWARDLIFLSLVFGALLGASIVGSPLRNPDEGRYAEIPREMIATGDWVTPRLDGVRYFEKPPLVYWTVAACEWAFGDAEWSVRLTPALFSLAGILLSYGTARRIYGRDAGFWTGIVLGSCLLYLALGGFLLLDTAVSILMSATLFCFILAVREPPGAARRGFYCGLYASAALATLTKGLIGFLLTGAVMFLWLALVGPWRRLRPMHLLGGTALFLALAAPWHVLMALRNPEWAHFYFVYEHWERYTSAGHAREAPFWIFVPVVLVGLFPWTGFLWNALREAMADGWSRRAEHPETWFFLIWAAFVFLFFSASHSKLIPYILPVFPALAVLVGRWLAGALAQPDAIRRLAIGLRTFAVLCGLLAVALCVAVLKPGLVRDPDQASQLRPYAFTLAVVLCLGALRAVVPRSGAGPTRARGALIGMSVTLVFLFGILILASPIIDLRSTKTLAEVARVLVRPADRVYHYHNYFQDFPYYSGRTVGLVSYRDELELQFADPQDLKARFVDDAEFRREWDGPMRVFAVARTSDAAALFGDPSFRYHVLARDPHHYLFSNQP